MNKQQPPLRINALTKMYGSDRGVEDINLELKSGEVFGFLGPNGAGKSTTIRAIMNFISPTEGTIEVDGLDSVNDSIDIKMHVGYLAGDIALYDWMTARQLLRHLGSLNRNIDWKYVDILTDKLGAELNRPIHDLSKGNKQKIGLIQAFMHRPQLLILDEPTSGLDPLMKQVFYDMIDDMKRDGKTVFVSSHDLTEVQKICDRAAFINEGKLIGVEDIDKADRLVIKRYTVTFDTPPDATEFEQIDGVEDVAVVNDQLSATITGEIAPFLSVVAAKQPLDFSEQDTALEDIFMHYYQTGGHDDA